MNDLAGAAGGAAAAVEPSCSARRQTDVRQRRVRFMRTCSFVSGLVAAAEFGKRADLLQEFSQECALNTSKREKQERR